MIRRHRRALAWLLILAAPPASLAATEETPVVAVRVVPRLVERARLLATPGRLERTILLPAGTVRAGASLRWEMLIAGHQVAAGRIAARGDDAETDRVTLSVPLPALAEPAGMDLVVEVRHADREPLRSTFPFTLYPLDPGRAIVSLFARSAVTLYDPEGSSSGIFESLGLEVRPIDGRDDLPDDAADLIVVGTGGFSRGHELLGPVLARRARDGTAVLLLDQPSLPSTLTHQLRLWPSFGRGPQTDFLFAAGHPAFEGSSGSPGAAYLRSSVTMTHRPYLPPTAGNFRVLAGLLVKRGPAWMEGVGIVELPIGRGTVVAAQTPIASDYSSEPGARILLVNLLSYLLGDRPHFRRTFLYGPAGEGSLPECIANLAPDAPPAPVDLHSVDLLIVPADWRAPRRRDRSLTAPLADVARFLHDGGTVLLVDPQPLVADYLSAVLGEWVEFEPFGGLQKNDRDLEAGGSLSLLQGIASTDLDLLDRRGEREFLLRSHRSSAPFEELFRVSGLSIYRVGSGSLVALAMPRSVTCDSPRAASLLARLLTNLGVPLDGDGPGSDARFTRRVP